MSGRMKAFILLLSIVLLIVGSAAAQALEADIGLGYLDSLEEVFPGSFAWVHFSVINNGPAVAQGTTITGEVPMLISPFPVVTATFGTIPKGGTLSTWIWSAILLPDAPPGIYTGTVTIGSQTHDPDLSNNMFEWSFEVLDLYPVDVFLPMIIKN